MPQISQYQSNQNTRHLYVQLLIYSLYCLPNLHSKLSQFILIDFEVLRYFSKTNGFSAFLYDSLLINFLYLTLSISLSKYPILLLIVVFLLLERSLNNFFITKIFAYFIISLLCLLNFLVVNFLVSIYLLLIFVFGCFSLPIFSIFSFVDIDNHLCSPFRQFISEPKIRYFDLFSLF